MRVCRRLSSSCQKSAYNRLWDFDLSPDYLYLLWWRQDSRCALSGGPLDPAPVSDLLKPSIDRIDTNRGYVQDNVQFVYLALNRMKFNYGEDEVRAFLTMLTLYRGRTILDS
jgi:hypothetical protein